MIDGNTANLTRAACCREGNTNVRWKRERMAKYVLKRLLLLIPIVLGISFIIFTIMDLTPGNPARLILGPDATAEAVEQLTEEMGLNRPFLTRFADYVVTAVTKLDFGQSYRTQKPVFNEVLSRFPVSLKLAGVSTLFAVLVGIPLGVFSADAPYSVADQILRVGFEFFVAVPPFWFAMMLILVFALNPRLAADQRQRKLAMLHSADDYAGHGRTAANSCASRARRCSRLCGRTTSPPRRQRACGARDYIPPCAEKRAAARYYNGCNLLRRSARRRNHHRERVQYERSGKSCRSVDQNEGLADGYGRQSSCLP